MIPVSIRGLNFIRSQYQSRYQDFNPESLNTSLDIKMSILKVSIPVSISRLQYWKSWYQYRYQDCNLDSLDSSLDINPKNLDTSLDIKTKLSKVLILIMIIKTSLAHHWVGHSPVGHKSHSHAADPLKNIFSTVMWVLLPNELIVNGWNYILAIWDSTNALYEQR